MLRISIQKNQFIHNPTLNSMAHLLTTLEINYNEKRVVYDSQLGEITSIKKIFQKIENYDCFKECVLNDEKNCYIIKVPIQIEWASGFFVTSYENQAREILESNIPMHSQLSSIIQVGKTDFSIENVTFQQEVSFSAMREICLNINDNVNIFDNLNILQFSGEINFSKFTQIKGALRIKSPNKTDKKEVFINGGAYSQLQIEESFLTKICLCNTKIEYGNFSKNTFKEEINFYGSIFKRCPNFSQSRFEGRVNLVNTNLFFDFESTEKQINLASKGNDKHLVANDFRDGFRLFKNALSKEGNVLDASNYHCIELYCKEIELDSKNPSILSKEWIDKWQLFFYRNTSDHHTDTLKSFNTLIALIGVFGFLCVAIVLGLDYFAFDYREGINILKLKESYSSHIVASIQNHTLRYFIGNLALVFVFLGLFLGVMWKYSRNILISLGYVMTLGFLATSPKYLIPAMSLFGGSRAVLDPLGIIGGVYTLLFGFLAYSFIKTIRKNSIIPS